MVKKKQETTLNIHSRGAQDDVKQESVTAPGGSRTLAYRSFIQPDLFTEGIRVKRLIIEPLTLPGLQTHVLAHARLDIGRR